MCLSMNVYIVHDVAILIDLHVAGEMVFALSIPARLD